MLTTSKKTILLILSLLLLSGVVFSAIHFWPHPPTLETTLKNSGQAGEEIKKNFSSEEQLAIQKTSNGFEVKDDLNLKIDFPQTYTNNITATLPGGKEIKIIDRNAKDISGKLLSSQNSKKDNDIVEYKLDNRKTVYYSYQKDGSGTRKIKNWILYQNGNGNEKESYQFQNAKITLDKVGNADVSYYDERSNSNPTPSTATLRIPKPFYIDKDGKRTDLDWKLDQKSNILSIEWTLSKHLYPIALDPTMIFSPSSANAAYEAQAANNTSTTISDYETTSFTAGNYTSVGTDDTDYATTTATHTPTYVDDVFSTYLYTGNGGTQTINNGIDLAGEGGLVWIKNRSGAYSHRLYSSGLTSNTYRLQTDTNNAEGNSGNVLTFNSNGWSIVSSANDANDNGYNYTSWTFRKAPKFFDVVTYTGDGTTNKVIAHNLGSTPGMIITKRIDSTGNWATWHRSFTDTKTYAYLNTADAAVTAGSATAMTVSDSSFTIGTNQIFGNGNGWQYVAYIFADDSSADGIIRCGSYTGNGAAAGQQINLGWEPQWILVRSSSNADNWQIYDTARGWTNQGSTGSDSLLYANLSNAESGTAASGNPNATGFLAQDNNINISGQTFIYCAIRRPNKPPTAGTGVYGSVAYTGNETTRKLTTNIVEDLAWVTARNWDSVAYHSFVDRLRGATKTLYSVNTSAEATEAEHINNFAFNDGIQIGYNNSYVNASGYTYIHHAFRRAPGVFDEVAYTGNGTTPNSVTHNLGVMPEMILIKARNTDTGWAVWDSAFGTNSAEGACYLNSTAAKDSTDRINSVSSTTFIPGTDLGYVNSNNTTYIAYLFATKPGISKVGSYTGNGSSQTINAGFTGGAKYILIKRTDNIGDWYVWDSTRGIVAGNDPHLSLNTTAAEVTGDDSVDPDNSGFIVNQNATTNINVNGGTYIYLAFSGDTISAPPTPPAVDTYATQLYTFNLPDMTNISKLQVDLTAYATASAGNGIVAKIWNNNTNDWETLTDLGNTDSSMPGTVSTQELTTNLSYYLDENNQAKILVSSLNPSDTSASAVLNVDYVNLTSISSAITTDTNDAYEASPTSTTSTTLSDYQTTALDAGDYAKVTAKDADYVSSFASSPQYVDDVFSTYLYTGNSSTQTIDNGIDLAGEGGLVWIKQRNAANAHTLMDTIRGNGVYLKTNTTDANISDTDRITSFNANGFSISSDPEINNSGTNIASWTFRKAPKFFDVVTYTGDGVAGRQIAHNLGIAPGMIVVKRTNTTENWQVWHGSANGGDAYAALNDTGQFTNGAAAVWGNGTTYIAPTSTDFTVSSYQSLNASGSTYVAYLFADDSSADGIIRCGSFTTDGSGNATVNLGWEPQWVLRKITNTTGNWIADDVYRSLTADGNGQQLNPNTSGAEVASSGSEPRPNATGFSYVSPGEVSKQFIYCAIRRPNKPPTSGTGVFASATLGSTGDGIAPGLRSGFPVDFSISGSRTGDSSNFSVFDRSRGNKSLTSSSTSAEFNSVIEYDFNNGIMNSTAINVNYLAWMFRRAPGVFDKVSYTGNGVSSTAYSHNLNTTPELAIIKRRDSSGEWWVCKMGATTVDTAQLQSTAAWTLGTTYGGSSIMKVAPTSTTFTLGNYADVNANSGTYTAYLFATKPGISKVGSYTGNGSSQTINAGFTGGAKYILIKRTDNTGDWYVWDSTRGIVAGNDPHLSLNTTAAEVTGDDSVDPDNSGFIVNQNATTNINVNGGTYIYLAFSGDTISAPATDKYATQLYSFDLSNISDITKLRVTMNAYATASAGNGVTAKIWNNHTNDWEILNTLTNTASSMPTTASKQDISSNVDYYLDNDNKVKILLTSTNPSVTGTDATIYTDLISVSSLTTPIVSTIDPVTTPNTNQTIDISLSGQNFASGATVTFKRTNQPDIPCKNVSVTSATALTCKANLRGANAGAWDIAVTNTDQMEGTLSGAMTVTEGPHAPFTTTGTVKLRGSVRMERSGERTSP